MSGILEGIGVLIIAVLIVALAAGICIFGAAAYVIVNVFRSMNE